MSDAAIAAMIAITSGVANRGGRRRPSARRAPVDARDVHQTPTRQANVTRTQVATPPTTATSPNPPSQHPATGNADLPC